MTDSGRTAGMTAADYRVREPFATRWSDNDQYGHLNNTVYYLAMDTAVNTWMMREGGLDPRGDVIALCAASACDFHASAAFPERLDVGIGVARLGSTSITWDLGILRGDTLIASGRFVHVFVDEQTRRPVAIPATIRAAVASQVI